MREKLLKTLKIILIIFGVLFLIQILIFVLIMFGFFSLTSAKSLDFKQDKIETFSNKPKKIQPIINYVENYYKENKKYPEKLEDIKLKENFEYQYDTTKDGNCYSIKVEEKNTVKQYQHCKTVSENSNSTSESYVEYSK